MYDDGRGVQQDYVLAYMWFELAIAENVEFALLGRQAVAKLMTPSQIAEAQKLAREWKPKTTDEN